MYVPSAVVRNFGLTPAVFPVTMDIGAGYAQTVQETLASGLSDTVVFPAWTAEPVGSLAVTCFTSLVGDEDPANDTIRDSVQVLPPPIHDVGAVAIVSPSGSVRAGDTVIPRARIRNFGNTAGAVLRRPVPHRHELQREGECRGRTAGWFDGGACVSALGGRSGRLGSQLLDHAWE